MNCFLPSHNLKILVKTIYALARLPGEDLYVEASADGLSLRTVNSSHSGYMCFLFKPSFFMHWAPATVNIFSSNGSKSTEDEDKTNGNYCKISMKSALIIYKAVITLEKSIESCSILLDVDEWRLIFELQCKSGVIRKYKLVLLNCSAMQASFDKKTMRNIISTPGKLLLDGVQQNFHSGQDEVTMTVDASGIDLRNYIDDAKDPEKILKTQVHLDQDEFDQFKIQGASEITFCLKELRALLTFVENYELPVTIRFDQPGRPIIFSLETDPLFVADLVLASFMQANTTIEQPPNAAMEQAIPEPQASGNRFRKPNLFAGWSQQTTLSASQFSNHQDDTDRVILAPDSDMEDN